MDGIESRQDLVAYSEQVQPAYQLLVDFDDDDRSRVRSTIIKTLASDALPTTIITDRAGNVLEIFAGVPDVSAVRRTLAIARTKSRVVD